MNEAPSTTHRAPKHRPQAVLRVKAKRRLSPRLTRVILEGDGVRELKRNDHADHYVKLLLPQPGSGLRPPFDLDEIRQQNPELLPSKRTYTIRHWDVDAGELWLDVVIHSEAGSIGIASDWADTAVPGDEVAVTGAGGAYTPRDDAAMHLLVGDHSAVPAIASALEAMPADACGTALIHLEHEEDCIPLPHVPGIEVRWIIGQRSELVRAVRELDIDPALIAEGAVHVFAHLERGAVKELRHHFVTTLGIRREHISISAYWALGRAEDQFQAEKREAIGQID